MKTSKLKQLKQMLLIWPLWLTGFLFIMALPASFALLANGYDLLSIAVFMTGGLAFLSSMAAMLINCDK
jgi:hypothetical protein